MKKIQSALFLILLLPVFLYGSEIVEVSVEVTEINNNKADELGIKWFDSVQAGEVSWSNSNRTPSSLPEVPSIISIGDWARYSALTANLKVLVEKGAAQILSKPKIATKSGSTAKFIVGGEIPVVTVTQNGVNVVWKEYGIKTTISPTILKDNNIDLSLQTEVSRIDWANKVLDVPAISKREADSSVIVKSGQTIALAGMLETKKEETVSGVPLLCDIPILGRLFSSKKIIENKVNVLIFVTPKILE